MVTQQISVSVTTSNNETAGKLVAEISNTHIVFIAKNNNTITAFELYEIDTNKTTWANIFSAVKNYSKALTYIYAQSIFYVNFNEAIVVPQTKFTKESIEPFLTSIYGNNSNSVVYFEPIKMPTNPTLIYRFNGAVHSVVKSNFNVFNYSHTYTKVLENLLGSSTMVMDILKVQFYKNTMLVCVVTNNKLQLAQTYNYNSPEDVAYFLLNIVQEFNLNVKTTPVEVSGMIDLNSKHFELLENLFGRLSFETVAAQGIFKEILHVGNAHYYTPFYNLAL